MSQLSVFANASRKAVASYLGSRTMRDIVVAYLIVLGALAFSICDAQALAPKTTIHTFQGGVDGGFPETGLISDTNGVLHGVSAGGQNGAGLVIN